MNENTLDRSDTYRYLFTVFTPTYNRAHTLSRVYESLLSQTERDFEWSIVDDGSSDGTRLKVEGWQQENRFPIRYIYQENQGKHIATNRGVSAARGELFLTLDSDDSCRPEALERFRYHWDSIPADRQANFSAVTCLCEDENGRIVGSKFPFDPTDSDSLEIHYRFHMTGEKWGFHRTSVMSEFPFPEITGCNYIPENIVWSAIAKKYKTRFVNESLRVYHTGEDRATDPGRLVRMLTKNSRAHALFHQEVLNKELGFFSIAPKSIAASAVHFSRFSFHAKYNIRTQFNRLKALGGKILWLIFLPVGTLVYLKDRTKIRALNSSELQKNNSIDSSGSLV
ncbi:glycosyltransferase family 2 protein [Chamaesiphon sp. VAR_69_metabat_338]|uniref:glycosyltransferase family 2 protein n=1 Tax=Chamaesiphon sp. VAR_69_metabat_338 TaxID=2964704 RepID=UPI00286E3B26|nr:glycosyltransferase family 2 protein [Chamaesiphon sp. VAR_69_metabat_338]